MRAATLLLAGALSLLACSNMGNVAQLYEANGKHELAALYHAYQYRRTPTHSKAREALVGSVAHALRSLSADYEASFHAGKYVACLGLAKRKADLLNHARLLGLHELSEVSVSDDIARAWQATGQQNMAALDAAVAANQDESELLPLLRVAAAYHPHNSELDAWYARKRARLQRHIQPAIDCPSEIESLCENTMAHMLALLTAQRAELTNVVAQESGREDTLLQLRMTAQTNDSDWEKARDGTVQKRIPRMNAFREHATDRKGNKLYDTVSAEFEIYSRTVGISLHVRAIVQELREGGDVLYERDLHLDENDTRSYIVWSGDSRALGDLLAVGTDQRPPASTKVLLAQAAGAAAQHFARQMWDLLEGGAK